MPVKDLQITAKLTELGISERVTVGSSLKLCIHLRALRLDARFTQAREVPVPPAEEHEALRAARVWRDEPSDWWAEGRKLVGIR